MFQYRKNLEVVEVDGEGIAFVHNEAYASEMDSLVHQMEEAQPTVNPLNQAVRDEIRGVAESFATFPFDGTWYDRCMLFVGRTILAAAGMPVPGEVKCTSGYWISSENAAIWLSWLYHNGTPEERAAASGLMPVVATLMIEGCIQDYWSNTYAIATYAMHQRVGRTKMVK